MLKTIHATTSNGCPKNLIAVLASSALKHSKEYVDKEILLAVYNAIIEPYFSYCCEVWNVLGETQSMRLQKLHNRAARIIAHVPNEVDQQTVLSILGWEPLEKQGK